ncbi:MAG TPA: hypothetical protein VF839_10350 [Clostridium sp.]
MNKIKNSFSKIKASDEFKGKLAKELLNGPKELKTTKTNLYFRPSIAVATLLILIGIISFKLIINASKKGSANLDSMTYASNEDSQINDTTIKEETQDINDNILTTEVQDILPSNNIKNEISSVSEKSSNDNNFTNKKSVHEDVVSKITETVTPNVSDVLVASANEKATLSNDVSNDKKNINSNNNVSDNIKTFASDNATSDKIRTFTSNVSINSVYIPKVQLPKSNALTTAKMMPLIVYKGNVYICTPIEIPSENAKSLLGRKLGTTKSNINEWSTQSDYSNEFASNIGVTNVYAVHGYDEDFRIMTNITTEDGKNYPEYYECLSGITVKNGADIFEKLKLQGNITQAKFQPFSDWNNGTGTFYTINDLGLLDSLLNEINMATPYLPEDIETSLGDYRNNDECKQISFDLKDGSKNITLSILKSGYVYYGYPRIYFKIDDTFTAELWDKLGTMHIN